MNLGSPPFRPPTAAELLADIIVSSALDQAWLDSQSNDAARRHEEGGWIYLDLLTGDLHIRRSASGSQNTIDLDDPPLVARAMLVGVFHTHPNPTAEGWQAGPSGYDQIKDNLNGVPDLIRADDGTHFSGPNVRRGGLTGNPGYPA